MLSVLLAAALASQSGPDVPGRGVSEALARERSSIIGSLRYELTFVVPEAPDEPIHGRVTLRFVLEAPHRVVIDIAEPAERVRSVRSGGIELPVSLSDGHLIVPAHATRAGQNDVTIEFVAGDDPFTREQGFLYTLFVPASAHHGFPCFDQPDLKARYSLSLDVPAGWKAVANGAEAATESDAQRTRIRFEETQPISTYLFAFAAGEFSVETAERDGREFRMFHRETAAAMVERNRDAIVDLHASALAWLEEYTAVPYPFGKFDVVAVPSFQFGGMEHPGAIFYNAERLLLEESATQHQMLGRASLIAHETAHMWFGDLVTMRWFDDVWMKEVFANVMAAKIVNPSFPEVDHDLRFLLSHYPAAYQVDRTAGANPIRQPLSNLDEAGQLYGPIIYQKAPIAMRQLELIVGEAGFREGLRAYLQTHRFGNATWGDLVRLLDARTPEDLTAWSRTWVEERGRPEFTTGLSVEGGLVSRLRLTATDPWQRGLVWPQRLRVALGYESGVRHIQVDVAAASVVVAEAEGMPEPLFVLPNGAGLGYGFFRLDGMSRDYLLGSIEAIADPLTRGSAWVTLWDNVMESHIGAGAFLDAAVRALATETDEQNIQQVLVYAVRAFWAHLDPDERGRRAPAFESMLWAGVGRASTRSEKAAWFEAFRDAALTTPSLALIGRVWRRDERIEGLPLGETDEIALALALAVREVPAWEDILQTQLDRIGNPDRRARFAFVMPALSADPAVREQAFSRLALPEHRSREPWVIESLACLNHPLRERHARQFIGPALDLLREIQRTGDIFFPTDWTHALLRGHRSPEAAAMVREFLSRELDYPQRLRWTILVAADELLRVAR
ncbi:MAG: M1 family aminopeptidase [Acidobacteria bacterium]|nr:M1 family aminopeptidase [Acidobacteriota bacterium]